ncbi:MAG: tRNA uridine-5-carboxymethylaminomethyl(34) synthesis GTPase MnmE [Pseudoflavonifractor sp.]|nr:tRNA uridine-5-carboxymethylaminomethyl(34) synthesis GTPase MnmE [Pseudoflavonifractor sp.]
MEGELVAAIATGAARCAIGVIRLSGTGAAQCAGAVFRAFNGKALWEHPPRALVYGTLSDREGREIDQVLATWSPAPHSYTGEETAELQCHGSPAMLALALDSLFAHGARQAGRGEFTRRAFLNGKLDLAQAEAVMDLIDAETPGAVRQAAGQLSGALSRRVEKVYGALVDVMAHFHAVLDYPDEDIDPFTSRTIREALERAQGELTALLGTYRRGSMLTRGVPCAIVGRPNAGKSTLLNALVGYERAIVTDVPGTTRDTVEERCVLGGVLLRLIDTAGLRETEDTVEKIGVERSRAAMEQAGLILAVMDRSKPFTQEDVQLLEEAKALAPTILVWNKADLPAMDSQLPPGVEISAKMGAGLDQLGDWVRRSLPTPADEAEGELLTNARQAAAAGCALETLRRAGAALAAGVTPDAVLTDVEEVLTDLGELTGRTVREDVTARIFQRFCVGK